MNLQALFPTAKFLAMVDLEESKQHRSAAEESELEEFSTTHPAKMAEPVSVGSSRR